MTEREKTSPVTELQKPEVDLYEVKLSPEEADTYFRQVKSALNTAQENPYGNLVDKLRGHLSDRHFKSLVNAFGILLPLTHQEVVQQGRTGEATPEKISQLLMDVGLLLGSFKNTGVEIIGRLPKRASKSDDGWLINLM